MSYDPKEIMVMVHKGLTQPVYYKITGEDDAHMMREGILYCLLAADRREKKGVKLDSYDSYRRLVWDTKRAALKYEINLSRLRDHMDAIYKLIGEQRSAVDS